MSSNPIPIKPKCVGVKLSPLSNSPEIDELCLGPSSFSQGESSSQMHSFNQNSDNTHHHLPSSFELLSLCDDMK